jgi:hypothetical protein
MNQDERKAYVVEQTEKRAELSKQLAEQNSLRDTYIAAEKAKTQAGPADSFDASVSETLKKQMSK